MRYVLIIFLVLVLLSGCQSYPRYRSGESKPPQPKNSNTPKNERLKRTNNIGKRANTADLIELGRIIQSYLGTPYKGRSQYQKGIDCSQFTGQVFKKFNKTVLPRTVKKQFETGLKKSRRELKFGDLVFFRINGRAISHVGIYVGYNEFVHASLSSGVRISNIKKDYWKERFVGGRRILR